MAGRIGSVQKAQDGQTYGFVIYDTQDRACVYLGFSSWHDADRAAREAQGLLVTVNAAAISKRDAFQKRGNEPSGKWNYGHLAKSQ